MKLAVAVCAQEQRAKVFAAALAFSKSAHHQFSLGRDF
jgi:hypothetical protein